MTGFDATPSELAPADHGIEIVPCDGGVDFVDTWAPGRPSVRLSHAEYESFLAGVVAGDFDVEALVARVRPPTQAHDGR